DAQAFRDSGQPARSDEAEGAHLPGTSSGRAETYQAAGHQQNLRQRPDGDLEGPATGPQGIEEDSGQCASWSARPSRSPGAVAARSACPGGARPAGAALATSSAGPEPGGPPADSACGKTHAEFQYRPYVTGIGH